MILIDKFYFLNLINLVFNSTILKGLETYIFISLKNIDGIFSSNTCCLIWSFSNNILFTFIFLLKIILTLDVIYKKFIIRKLEKSIEINLKRKFSKTEHKFKSVFTIRFCRIGRSSVYFPYKILRLASLQTF